jgi:hypothetical protein
MLSDYTEVNKGGIGECKRSQATKRISLLKERVEKALWFAMSFGVELKMLKVSDENGKTYDLLSKQNSSFDKLPDEEKEKVKHLLFILDLFGISDGAYHELTLQSDNMIKSYLIKQCRYQLNSMCTISTTPREVPGAQMNVRHITN